MAGDRVVIGAPYNDGNGALSGHEFMNDGTAWLQLGIDLDGEALMINQVTSIYECCWR